MFTHEDAEVNVPTLVIWGEKDPFLLTSNLKEHEMFVPHVRIKRIPDGTHWVIHEKPALVDTFIREFIEDQSSRSELKVAEWSTSSEASL